MLQWLRKILFKSEQKKFDSLISELNDQIKKAESIKASYDKNVRYLTIENFRPDDIEYLKAIDEIVKDKYFLFFINKFRADRENDLYNSIDKTNDNASQINLGLVRAIDMILAEMNGIATLYDLWVNKRENDTMKNREQDYNE